VFELGSKRPLVFDHSLLANCEHIPVYAVQESPRCAMVAFAGQDYSFDNLCAVGGYGALVHAVDMGCGMERLSFVDIAGCLWSLHGMDAIPVA
jgi:hypothetical protein